MIFLRKNVGLLIFGLIILLVSASAANAQSVKGVDFADEVTLAGKKLYLNGVGVKKSFFQTIYVAGLYLPHPTSDPAKAIKIDTSKQIILQVITSKLSKDKIVEEWNEGFFNNSQEMMHTLQEKITTFNSFFNKDMVANDRINISYISGLGTEVKINSETNIIIPGSDFMQALWAIWLGTNPADNDLKNGLLGK